MLCVRLALLACLLAGTTAHAGPPELKPWTGANPPPQIELKTLEGQPFRLEQLRGKVVLVNFWATWCEPCVKEMPSMQKLRTQLEGEPFEIVAVNLQESESRIRAFLQEVPVTFPIVRDADGAVTQAWRAHAFPSSYLLDAEGRIRYALAGAIDWSSPEALRVVRELWPESRPTMVQKP